MCLLQRQESGSAVCYSCEKIISVDASECSHCGIKNPSLWGYVRSVRMLLGNDLGFAKFVIWSCIALFALSLLLSYILSLSAGGDGVEIENSGPFGVLSPNPAVLFFLGATGSVPIFQFGRWWTVLSAGWLHGGLLHIAFNMIWLSRLSPAIAKFYGSARLIIIYTASVVSGSLISSWAGQYLAFLPEILQGSQLSIGASGGVFGLLGALVSYGDRVKNYRLRQQAFGFAVFGFLFGFVMGGIDNWGHLGGFLGGYYITHLPWFSHKRVQNRRDFIIAIFCYGLVLASVLASAIHLFFLLLGT